MAARPVLLLTGEGEFHQRIGGLQGEPEHAGEGCSRDGDLVSRYGQSCISNVKHPLGGASVIHRIVQNPLGNSIGMNDIRFEFITLSWQ